jgi:hypothetical protein
MEMWHPEELEFSPRLGTVDCTVFTVQHARRIEVGNNISQQVLMGNFGIVKN